MRRICKENHFGDVALGQRLGEQSAHGGVPLEIVVAFVVKIGGLGVILRHEETLRPPVDIELLVVVGPHPVKRRVRRPAAYVVTEYVERKPAVAVKHFHGAACRFLVALSPQTLIYPRRRRPETRHGLHFGVEVDDGFERRKGVYGICRKRHRRKKRDDGDNDERDAQPFLHLFPAEKLADLAAKTSALLPQSHFPPLDSVKNTLIF